MRFVEKISPYNTEVVERDIIIDVRFFVDVDTDTINSQNIILFDLKNQRVVETTFEYNRRRLLIKPIESLEPNGEFEIILKAGPNGIKDIVGMEMMGSYKSEFRTKAIEKLKPPAIVSPMNRTIVDAPVSIKISPSENATYYQIQIAKTNRFDKIEWPVNEQLFSMDNETIITPDLKWGNTNYYLRARSTDGSNEASEFGPVIQIYVSVPDVEESSDEVDEAIDDTNTDTDTNTDIELGNINEKLETNETTKKINEFKLLSATPDKDSINVPINDLNKIILRFSDNIDLATVNSNTVYVVKQKN